MNKTALKKEKAALMAAQGNSQADIAVAVGKSQPTVSRWLNDEEIKTKVDSNRRRIIEKAADRAIDNLIYVVEKYKEPVPDKCSDRAFQMLKLEKEHGIKVSREIASTMGVIDSHAQSNSFVQNIFDLRNSKFISPIVDRMISQAINVIDAEVIGDHGDE